MDREFNDDQGALLLKLARQAIENKLDCKMKTAPVKKKDLPETVENKRGIFVSLHKKGSLRGCIGNIEPVKTIFEGVVDNAKHAAFDDTRFSPLVYEELKDTVIEVSILTPTAPLDYKDGNDLISKLRPGIDGVTVKKGYQSATFLPQVWEQLKDPEDFLTHLCMKAGLSPDEWKSNDLDVSVYQVQSFEE